MVGGGGIIGGGGGRQFFLFMRSPVREVRLDIWMPVFALLFQSASAMVYEAEFGVSSYILTRLFEARAFFWSREVTTQALPLVLFFSARC